MGTPERNESGQRPYDQDASHHLSFIRHARDLGFSMEAIRDLIKLQADPGEDSAAVDVIERNQLADVRSRLNQLEALEAELKNVIKGCKGGKVGHCRIIAVLNEHSTCLNENHERLNNGVSDL